MARRAHDLFCRPFLQQPAGVEHPDAVAEPGDHPDVVADQQDRRVDLALQRLDQVEHLGLDGRVQRGRRLVQEEHLRIRRERHRDQHALLLPGRELVRVAAEDAGGIADRVPR